jgi:hypothetical protein
LAAAADPGAGKGVTWEDRKYRTNVSLIEGKAEE